MIYITDKIDISLKPRAELIKLICYFECYRDDNTSLFWQQDNGKAYISMVDNNMIIYNNNANIAELNEFINVISPQSIFSDVDTLKLLSLSTYETVNVMHRKADLEGSAEGDVLSSKEIYDILNVDGLQLPDYPHFAVDFCRRLNRDKCKYFALNNKCAAITVNAGNFALLNGIASRVKGYGTIALKAIIAKNHGSDFLVCCRDKVKEFYIKNGFVFLYKAGYWVK